MYIVCVFVIGSTLISRRLVVMVSIPQPVNFDLSLTVHIFYREAGNTNCDQEVWTFPFDLGVQRFTGSEVYRGMKTASYDEVCICL